MLENRIQCLKSQLKKICQEGSDKLFKILFIDQIKCRPMIKDYIWQCWIIADLDKSSSGGMIMEKTRLKWTREWMREVRYSWYQ